jgi:TonB family protein
MQSSSRRLFSFFVFVLFCSTSAIGQIRFNDKVQAEIAELEQKIAHDADNPLLLYKLGDLNLALAHYPEAIDAFRHALKIKPDFAIAHYRLGWLYVETGNYSEALKAHEQASAFTGLNQFNLKLEKSAALHAIGWDYYCMEKYDEAIEAYQNSLQYDSRYQDSLYEIGRIKIVQGDRDEVGQIAGKLKSPYNEWLLKELSFVTPRTRTTPTPPSGPTNNPEQMTGSRRPNILYKEKAKYTEIARQHWIRGTVVLNVIFAADGQLGTVRVIRALPYGLTAQALTAAEKIRFEPAVKEGQAVSVRGNIEYSFNLY